MDFCSVASCSFISACGFPKVVGDDRVECTGACMLCQRSQNSSALWKSSPWIVRPHIGTRFRRERRLLRPPRHHDGVCHCAPARRPGGRHWHGRLSESSPYGRYAVSVRIPFPFRATNGASYCSCQVSAFRTNHCLVSADVAHSTVIGKFYSLVCLICYGRIKPASLGSAQIKCLIMQVQQHVGGDALGRPPRTHPEDPNVANNLRSSIPPRLHSNEVSLRKMRPVAS